MYIFIILNLKDEINQFGIQKFIKKIIKFKIEEMKNKYEKAN